MVEVRNRTEKERSAREKRMVRMLEVLFGDGLQIGLNKLI